MELEHKSINFEIKEIDDKGHFTGIASPYDNVDFGNDRVRKSIAKRNANKTVPYLWSHDTHEPIGEVKLIATDTGINIDGQLFLDTTPAGAPTLPNAYKAYTLMKNKLLSNSIGYSVMDKGFKYVTEGNQTIRDLLDIDIKEVSGVLFPMNEKAKISSVKSQETEKKEDGNLEGDNKEINKLEEKAMSFTDLLKVQQANDMRWKLQDALNTSFRQLMNDENMEIDAKLAQLETNVNDFATAYKEAMKLLLQASSKSKAAKKEIMEALEIKDSEKKIETKENPEELETKAGKKISKANKTKLSQCKDMMADLAAILASMCEDDSGDGEGEDDKSKKKEPAAEPSSVNSDDKQKKNNCDTLELKSEDLTMLQGISNFFNKKGDEE